tara:strand:+ start:190 stop:606 length:417 start_codon:yes stop_codon:yes gene_type:complete
MKELKDTIEEFTRIDSLRTKESEIRMNDPNNPLASVVIPAFRSCYDDDNHKVILRIHDAMSAGYVTLKGAIAKGDKVVLRGGLTYKMESGKLTISSEIDGESTPEREVPWEISHDDVCKATLDFVKRMLANYDELEPE